MVGLTTAYYLSNHKNNKVIVLEKNHEPYLGTSMQNGNWMPINYTFNWLDIAFYPNIINALKSDQFQNGAARMYYKTFFEDPCNFLTTMKFGFKWLLSTLPAEKYNFCALSFYKQSKVELKKIIKDEGLDFIKDFGYIEGSPIILL